MSRVKAGYTFRLMSSSTLCQWAGPIGCGRWLETDQHGTEQKSVLPIHKVGVILPKVTGQNVQGYFLCLLFFFFFFSLLFIL